MQVCLSDSCIEMFIHKQTKSSLDIKQLENELLQLLRSNSGETVLNERGLALDKLKKACKTQQNQQRTSVKPIVMKLPTLGIH